MVTPAATIPADGFRSRVRHRVLHEVVVVSKTQAITAHFRRFIRSAISGHGHVEGNHVAADARANEGVIGGAGVVQAAGAKSRACAPRRLSSAIRAQAAGTLARPARRSRSATAVWRH